MVGAEVANAVRDTALAHLRHRTHELHRILVYDCKPIAKKAHNPITKQSIDFSKTDAYRFRTDLHASLIRTRKVALRLGELASAYLREPQRAHRRIEDYVAAAADTRAAGRTSHAASAGRRTIAPSMFTRNMNVSMIPMSA